jgi:hypothetical protein
MPVPAVAGVTAKAVPLKATVAAVGSV